MTDSHYNRFRTYDPSTGRYVSADPVGQLQLLSSLGAAIHRVGPNPAATPLPTPVLSDLNLYHYVGQNPVANVDPSGEGAIGAVCFAVAGAGFAKSIYDVVQLDKQIKDLTAQVNALKAQIDCEPDPAKQLQLQEQLQSLLRSAVSLYAQQAVSQTIAIGTGAATALCGVAAVATPL